MRFFSKICALPTASISCDCEGDAAATRRATLVRTKIVHPETRRSPIRLSVDVQARARSDLSSRISGRVREPGIDVGSHVNPGELRARIAPAERAREIDPAPAMIGGIPGDIRPTLTLAFPPAPYAASFRIKTHDEAAV